MLRRLLACLALLSGLAAIGAPANPALAEATTGEIGASLVAQQAEALQDCPSTSPSPIMPVREPRATPGSSQRKIRIHIPTVQFGADRAFE